MCIRDRVSNDLTGVFGVQAADDSAHCELLHELVKVIIVIVTHSNVHDFESKVDHRVPIHYLVHIAKCTTANLFKNPEIKTCNGLILIPNKAALVTRPPSASFFSARLPFPARI
eukprot:TRINITY_DN6879_c0_g2_i1.p1 TRINITY_DN6879_c0_g2~~TRINITY_DN6879_c0_g2_i1.p1  ORF type:complete len:114 (+),score=22.45 TRINITY_DN6879_c0_g2_i1:64-405(+)